MSKQHTPGPWIVVHLPAATDDSKEAVFSLRSGRRNMTSFAEQDANARLIAAAPDLYAALKAAASFIENVRADDPDRNTEFFRCRELWRIAFSKAREGA